MRDIKNLMKQAQQMQQRMSELQEKLAGETMEATSGGGMVTAVVNGGHELVSIRIQRQVVDPEDVEMLEDLILGAVNEAHRKIQEHVQAEMGRLSGGFNIPGLM